MKRSRGALCIAVALGLVFAPSAASYTGAITRSYSNATWTRGSLAGSINWTDCGGAPCSWIPYASVQPSLPEYRCLGDEALDSDPNTLVVWNGGSRSANGTASFDVTDVPILNGVYGQHLCLSVIETVQIRDPVCVAQAPVLGYDPNTCPFIDRILGRVVTTAILSVEPTPPAQGTPGTPGTPPPQADTTAPALRLSGAKSQKVLRRRAVIVVAASLAEASTVSAKGRVSVRGSAKVFKFTPVTKQIPKGAKATLKLKLKSSAVRAIGRALKAGKRVSAKVTLRAKDAAGNITTKRRTIRLKR